MERAASLGATSRVEAEHESAVRAGVERSSTLSLFVTVLAGLSASNLSYDWRTTVSLLLPTVVFAVLWASARRDSAGESARHVYGWAAACVALLSLAGGPVLITQGPVIVVCAVTVVIAAWMRSIRLVALSIACAVISFTALGGALAFAAETPDVNVPLCIGLLTGVGLAYSRVAHKDRPVATPLHDRAGRHQPHGIPG